VERAKGFPIDVVTALFPDPIEASQKKWAAEEKRRSELYKVLQSEALQAIGLLADAARSPGIARGDLREAQKHLDKAQMAAFKLDPEEFEEEENALQRSPSGTNHDLTPDQRADMPRTV
jgi:hypothetical protein